MKNKNRLNSFEDSKKQVENFFADNGKKLWKDGIMKLAEHNEGKYGKLFSMELYIFLEHVTPNIYTARTIWHCLGRTNFYFLN